MTEAIKRVKTSSEILNDISRRQSSGELSLADLLLRTTVPVVQQQAIGGTIYFLQKGCFTKCLPSDIKGTIT